ncbi:hypothetical protein SAMN05660284_01699 [Formivibrio citricus]|uniref:Uncharacterized protein n=1 Tax=Formivibrio citricus TaxID=83765 RepID=A0A1I4ZSJ4_9NEIS|nr:DUF5718 family protein [Formivibrio citricus]SFN53236.1 hypothetical protein SAMN05660284_01699 [Formivibrio citricus]
MKLTDMIGLGIAGNFAGHLEQAGEASDFVNVKVKDPAEPKAIFPFYVPNRENSFLNVFPIAHDRICYPDSGDNLQIEPEVALICDIVYEGSKVKALVPREFAAFNDCSIRRPGARKISEKKNWGPASKGLATTRLALTSFTAGCELDHYHIASFLLRDGQCHAYGMDSPAVEYSYFHEKLLNWVVDKMNHQQDDGPAEDIPALLQAARYPQQAIVGIGATRYLPFGEQTFLQPGDESIVAVYDSRLYAADAIRGMAESGEFAEPGISVVRQKVTAN